MLHRVLDRLLPYVCAAAVSSMLVACNGHSASQQLPPTLSANPSSTRVGDARRQVRYRVYDIGTFGGPVSSFSNVGVLSNDGTAAGWSATSMHTDAQSSPLICGGVDGAVPFITKAFQWRGGVVSSLPALPGADNCNEVFAINSAGVETGTSENGQFDPFNGFNKAIAVRWVNGRIERLGGFGGNQNAGTAINDRGQIVGESQNTIPDEFGLLFSGTQVRAFLWQDGKMCDLGTLGGNDSFANAINEHGQVAGISYRTTKANPSTGIPTLDPFIWENGKMRDLGTLGGLVASNRGVSVNNVGQVAGGSSTAANPAACLTEFDPNCHVFLWQNGRLRDLTTTSTGGRMLGVSKLTDRGEIVGDAFVSSRRPDEAALWKNGTIIDLGRLCGSFSFADDINRRGQIVGTISPCRDGSQRAFLWEKGRMYDLNLLVPADSPLSIVEADLINDEGVIAGEGVAPGAPYPSYHAVVLVPIRGDGEGAWLSGEPIVANDSLPTSADIARYHLMLSRLLHHFGRWSGH